MKWVILISIIASLPACRPAKSNNLVNKHDNRIVYHLPDSVTDLLLKRIANNDQIYFFLTGQEPIYSIYLASNNSKLFAEHIFKQTNRCVFIKGQFYPLVLDYDETFADTECADSVLARFKRDKYFGHEHLIITAEWYQVKFKRDGHILYEGI
jgi:hypothetical protein